MSRFPLLTGVFFQPETRAIIASVSQKPSQSRARLMNTTIVQLKSAGLWSKLRMMHVINQNLELSLANWINPAINAVAVNAPTFTPNFGINGDGATQFIDTQIQPGSIISNIDNQAIGGLWEYSAVSQSFIGQTNAAQTHLLVGAGALANFNSRVGATASIQNGSGPYSNVIAVAVRTNAANYDVYRNAVFIANNVQASATSGAFNITYLRQGATGFAAASTFWKFGFLSDGLTGTDITNLNTIIRNYLSSIGAI